MISGILQQRKTLGVKSDFPFCVISNMLVHKEVSEINCNEEIMLSEYI